ncbi:MAG TPA: type II toxin-antitoxin system VapC family toxin [Candidatus Angelobacter sp.]|nr:type II toxin-antitoxin system VapC family toxin [Candidatus Angelobacter sp.]
MRAIDTNVLVRLITRDDPAQVAAAERFIVGGVWVSAIALVEAIWVVSTYYDFSNSGLAEAIEMVLHHPDVTVQDPETVALALDLFRSRPSLGFSDCMVLEAARKAGHLPLGTFDKKLARLDGVERL